MTSPLLYLVAGILLGCMGVGLVGVVCARIFVQSLRRESAARLRDHEQLLREILANCDPALALDEAHLPQRVQHAIQVELEYLTQRQLERDVRHAEDMDALRQALGVRSGPAVARAAAAAPRAPKQEAPMRIAPSPPAVSARPLELMHTPLPRPEMAHVPELPELELSDEEIDALPPDLPQPAKPRKRAPAPSAQSPMRSI